MFTKITAGVLSLSLLFFTPLVFAAPPKPPGDKAGQNVSPGPRKHLANIVLAGVAGATLGLSTLSFYGRPQDRLSNIAVGAAIGVIIGALYTTYKAAAEPKDFYGLRLDAKSEAWRIAETETRLTPPSEFKTGWVFHF